MALKITADSLEELPETLREQATEADGKFTLASLPTGFGVDNLAKLRGQLAEATKKHANAAAKILTKEDGTAYSREELDALMSQIADLTKTNETLSAKDKSTQEKLAELVSQAKKPLEQENAKLKTANDRYRSGALSSETDKVVDRILEVLNPLPQFKGVMRMEVRRHIKAVEGADGTIATSIIDPDANGVDRFSAMSGNNGPMGWEEFAKSKILREPFGQCLAGDGKEGAGPVGRGDGTSRPRPGNGKPIVLPAEHSQQQFEAAWKQANEQGVELRIDGEDA